MSTAIRVLAILPLAACQRNDLGIGTNTSDDNKAVTQKMKDAFETTTSPPIGSP